MVPFYRLAEIWAQTPNLEPNFRSLKTECMAILPGTEPGWKTDRRASISPAMADSLVT